MHRPGARVAIIMLLLPSITIALNTTSSSSCPRGEYTLGVECWPCEPGFYSSTNGTKHPCPTNTWSGRGFDECVKCTACDEGKVLIQPCSPERGDAVCSECPPGFECHYGSLRQCNAGWYSSNDSVSCTKCPANFTSEAGSDACECMRWNGDACEHCQSAGMIVVGTACRPTPAGFGMRENGSMHICPKNTFSTAHGKCTRCGSNAASPVGASQCDCISGYVTTTNGCTPCKSGTVYDNRERKCTLCTLGHFCLGKTHMEPCPPDTWAHRGAAMCSQCRINSWCGGGCTDAANCTCDSGFVGSECTRCPERTTETDDGKSCTPCPPGKECKGGADVRNCALSTWSNGSLARCNKCQTCAEITATRCNATHDSVCERTATALAVINVYQQYKTHTDGETFAMFAMVYTATIPKATLLRICDLEKCIQCFQGICPSSTGSNNRLITPDRYEIVIQLRTDIHRLTQNLEALTQTAFLAETAKITMAKLTDQEFVFTSRVEHTVICPDQDNDDDPSPTSDAIMWGCQKKNANAATTRTWVGFALAVLITACILICTTTQKARTTGYMPAQPND